MVNSQSEMGKRKIFIGKQLMGKSQYMEALMENSQFKNSQSEILFGKQSIERKERERKEKREKGERKERKREGKQRKERKYSMENSQWEIVNGKQSMGNSQYVEVLMGGRGGGKKTNL